MIPPLYPSSQQYWLGGQQDQGHGVVLHDQGEYYQQAITFGSWIRQVYKCWGGVLQVLRPSPFTNVGLFRYSLFFLGVGPIPYFRLEPIDPRSSFVFKRDNTYCSQDLRNFQTDLLQSLSLESKPVKTASCVANFVWFMSKVSKYFDSCLFNNHCMNR